MSCAVRPFAGASIKNLGSHIDFLRELIESGKLRTVVSRRYPFAQIAEAQLMRTLDTK
jgi:NADPH:quinone reductase-like Zn-dependent oxidoreductase